ncbi:hypothetical protein BX600DRAFT_540721 [Xylariales sp. PMI_506]|nr:hypothetical protein BX600DRAFT_540721 [Xylariales sp. PMI_506]
MANETGFLIPPWYKASTPGDLDLNIASIIWGFSLSCGTFTFIKAVQQSWKAYKRKRLFNAYIIMVWAEWTVCIIISILGWLYLSPSKAIEPSFWIYFGFQGIVVLWVIQIHCILQIIINRVRLLVVDQRRADMVKWGVAIFVGLINISVFIIWIPARLQISQRWMDINSWWDRCEKAMFAVIDIALNLSFIYFIRSKLIANGLEKYKKLFWCNLGMILVSMSLDVILIGLMSLSSSPVYIQFHPLAYLVKLHIEMNLAELISKIVKAANQLNEYGFHHGESGLNPPSAGFNASANSGVSKKSIGKKRDLESIDGAIDGIDFADSEQQRVTTAADDMHGFDMSSIDVEQGLHGRHRKNFQETHDEQALAEKATSQEIDVQEVEESSRAGSSSADAHVGSLE